MLFENNLNIQNDHFVSVVALCAHFNLSLMVRYVCIGPVQETGKKLAVALMRRLADLNLIICTLYQKHYFGVFLSSTKCA